VTSANLTEAALDRNIGARARRPRPRTGAERFEPLPAADREKLAAAAAVGVKRAQTARRVPKDRLGRSA
jgi:hypothetical protein